MKSPKKQFFQNSDTASKKSSSKEGPKEQSLTHKPKHKDSRSKSKDQPREPRGFGKKRSHNEREENTYYQGRSKDEKPVFGSKKPERLKKPKKSFGFGKNRQGGFNESDSERPEYKFESIPSSRKKSPDEEFRLNKFIANSGICSRREADELIKKGEISVNGEVVTEMGLRVKRSDRVVYQGKKINPEKPVYILLNKPKDFITTTDDPLERKTVMNLVKNACDERIFPVGRLDRNTTGLLFFTNDGELAAKLSHPSNQVKKIYQVTLDKPLSQNDEADVREGLTLEDGPAPVDDIQVLSKDRKILGLEIHIGRNRIVRRIFAHLGYEVTALDRVMYAGLDKKDLKRGNYRFLSEKEVIRLKYFI
ncbi:pseudouridine synthase [Algoriphagus sediminis]|uniref:Pseudouridine synthase n=1 Tax=Algoriphagus sediminis TaxID=3057113 RepID=A0ABT7YEB6_9BACT|nr:pseudouridine synthase [Algoriphagus sediminis]MDN3204865.1 pseudouridine synthase [Algoriphagus sediminis]